MVLSHDKCCSFRLQLVVEGEDLCEAGEDGDGEREISLAFSHFTVVSSTFEVVLSFYSMSTQRSNQDSDSFNFQCEPSKHPPYFSVLFTFFYRIGCFIITSLYVLSIL